MFLQTAWFVLWGVLWAVYFVLDGFDLGLGTIMPAVAKTDKERRMVLNSAGPFWDGNEVWLIAAGGVTFAAFPKVYAVLFSGLYTALLLLLFALIFRGASFEFRSKMESASWRKFWDGVHTVSSFLPALLLGTAFANIFMGIPINGEGINEGSFWGLLNPYGLAGGVFFVALFAYHGALWLAIKTEGPLQERSIGAAKVIWPFALGLALLFLGLTATYTNIYANYAANPWMYAVLVLALMSFVLTRVFLGSRSFWSAWAFSGLAIAGVTWFGLLGIFPRLLPSSLDDAYSLTAYNASSSPLTLAIMFGVALAFVPIVIIYQAWAYKTFSFKVKEEDMESGEAY